MPPSPLQVTSAFRSRLLSPLRRRAAPLRNHGFRRVLVFSEVAQAALVLVVPLAAALGHLNVAVVLAVMPLLAVSDLVSGPAQHAANLVMPVGMLLGGLAGARVGSRTVMLAGGLGAVLLAAYWLAVPSLRRFGPPNAVTPDEFA